MNIDVVKHCLVSLDYGLTEKSVAVALHTMQNQQAEVERLMEGVIVTYYLSDGGYSRLVLNPLDRTVTLASESTKSVKCVWSIHRLDGFVNRIVTEINAEFASL